MAKKAAPKKKKPEPAAAVEPDSDRTSDTGELRCTCAGDGRRTGPCPKHDAAC